MIYVSWIKSKQQSHEKAQTKTETKAMPYKKKIYHYKIVFNIIASITITQLS